MNVAFEYLYRDRSNYKNYGEVVLTTTSGLPIHELEQQIRNCLIDGAFFVAESFAYPRCTFQLDTFLSVMVGMNIPCMARTECVATASMSIEELIACMTNSLTSKHA